MKTLFISLITLLLTAFSCERDADQLPVADPTQLVGDWQLIEPDSPYTVTLSIEPMLTNGSLVPPTTYRASGRSSVNQYSAFLDYAPEGSTPGERRLTMGPITTTKIGGSPEAMQFETAYYATLQTVTRYELTSDNRLRLYATNSPMGVLVYERTRTK